MGLYEAMHQLLVTEGPLSALYLFRLPDESVHDADVALIPISGVGATRAFGSKPDGRLTGLRNDGGVQYYHTGTQFQVRAGDPENVLPVMEAADNIRDVLVQYAGTEIVKEGERIVRCDVTSAPAFYEQDERGRAVAALTIEVWHRPTSDPDSVPETPVDPPVTQGAFSSAFSTAFDI